MPVDNQIEVAGIKEALRELNDIDKKLRRQITRDYQEIVKPVVMDAQALVPPAAPLSGFERSWTPAGSTMAVLPFGGGASVPREPSPGNWQTRGGRRKKARWLQWKYGIRGYVSGKQPRTFNNYTKNLATFGIRWQGPTAVLFDTSAKANTPQGAQMIAALQARYGRPSRVMWRAYQSAGAELQGEMRDLVNEIMAAVDRKTRV